jgi:hypothetical protein
MAARLEMGECAADMEVAAQLGIEPVATYEDGARRFQRQVERDRRTFSTATLGGRLSGTLIFARRM